MRIVRDPTLDLDDSPSLSLDDLQFSIFNSSSESQPSTTRRDVRAEFSVYIALVRRVSAHARLSARFFLSEIISRMVASQI